MHTFLTLPIHYDMKKLSVIISNSAVLVSAIVGVGLLGGKELTYYFEGGIWSVIIFGVLFVSVNYILLDSINKLNADTLPQFCTAISSKRDFLINWIFGASYFVIISVMLAGAQQCLTELLSIDVKFPLFAILTAGVCCIILQGGIERIKIFNSLATIPIVLYVISTFIIMPQTPNTPTLSITTATDAIQYVTYNATLSMGVLCSIKQHTKSGNFAIALISGVMLCVIIGMITTLPLSQYNNFAMPSLISVRQYPLLYAWGVASVFLAILTSLLSNAFVLTDDITKVTHDRAFAVMLVMTSATLLSLVGIDYLIQNAYPLLSAFGIVTLVCCVVRVNLNKVNSKQKAIDL